MRVVLTIARSIRDVYILIGVFATFLVALALHFAATWSTNVAQTWIAQPGHLIAVLIFIDGLFVCWQFTESIAQDRHDTRGWHRWATTVLVTGVLLAVIGVALALYATPITWNTLLFLMAASRLLFILIPFLLLAAQQTLEDRLSANKHTI
jgi:hypothetical protein